MATTQSEQLERMGSANSLPLSPAAQDNQHRLSSSTSTSSKHAIKRSGLVSRFVNSELGRTFFSLLFFAVVCLTMAFCNQFSDHRWVDTGYTKVLLEDRGFDIFPAQKSITPANAFVLTSIVFTLIGMALICPDWTARAIVVRRVFWVVGTLSVYRAITLTVTTMPTPKEGCVPATATGFWPMLAIAFQMIPGTVQACTDDIFSGHTVFMVTCAIQWRLYCRNKWITYFSYIYITVGLYFVIATRLHYTVDVVLAIFITYSVWSLYIAMIDVVMEKEYFGLRRQNEKYSSFNDRWSETETENHISNTDESEKELSSTIVAESSPNLASRKAALQQRVNRLRGPGIGYDRGEHDRVAFVPVQYNTWLTGAVRWCDGLDLRMHQPTSKNWDELVVSRQSEPKVDAIQKAEIQEIDLEVGQSHSSNHGRDATVAPVMLESVHVINNSSTAGSN